MKTTIKQKVILIITAISLCAVFLTMYTQDYITVRGDKILASEVHGHNTILIQRYYDYGHIVRFGIPVLILGGLIFFISHTSRKRKCTNNSHQH